MVKDIIVEIFNENKARYGYPRITLELRNRGIIINHKKVQRIMKLLGLKAINRRSKYKSYRGEIGRTCDNVLLDKATGIRHFETTRINQKWTTDISEFSIPSGKLYLSPILDMHNREIISYNISTRPNYNQVVDMLNKAFNQYNDLSGLIFHSDQGWQYQMNHYQSMLKRKGIIQSMSRKVNCLDTSFF